MNRATNQDVEPPHSRRLLWVSLGLGSALSVAGAIEIATQRLVLGSPEGAWVYGYATAFTGRVLQPFLISSVLCAALVAGSWPWLRRLDDMHPGRRRVREWALVFSWCSLAVVVQGLLRSLTPYSLGPMFASDMSNSFYSVASQFNVESILGDFGRLRGSWGLHAQSNLPGKILLVRALLYLSTDPEVLAWTIVVLSNLGGVLLFIFVRDLFADRFLAVLSLILFLFTPAKLYFFPLLNTITPVAVLVCACLLLRWLDTGRTIYAALLGAAVYGLMLFEPTTLVIGLLFAILIARAIISGRITAHSALRQVVVGALTFTAVYVAMILWFRFDLISAFRQVAQDALEFNDVARRPYNIWVRENIYEFLFGVGLCQIVLFAAALVDGAASLSAGRKSVSSVSIVLLCSATAAMVGTADVIGVNRGEVIRLWIFLACLWQIPAAYVCRRLGSSIGFAVVLITTLLQDALGTAMIAFVVP